MKQCENCNGSYYEKEQMTHSCIQYVLSLLRVVLGETVYGLAVKKVNAKYDQAEKDGISGSKLKDGAESGFIESMLKA